LAIYINKVIGMHIKIAFSSFSNNEEQIRRPGRKIIIKTKRVLSSPFSAMVILIRKGAEVAVGSQA